MNKILDNVNNFIELILNRLEETGFSAFDSISALMIKFYAISIFTIILLVSLSILILYISG